MKLGTFSLSLSVKDITASLGFYTKLGFEVIDGGHINEEFKDTDEMKWRIIKNESVKLGLFQGIFDDNILTFNPEDVLSIQNDFKSKGLTLIKETSESEAMKSIMLADPDGNQIMMDQH